LGKYKFLINQEPKPDDFEKQLEKLDTMLAEMAILD
jgi:hypothetical protein